MPHLFARKPISELQPPDDEARSLSRVLGAGDLVMLAIGAFASALVLAPVLNLLARAYGIGVPTDAHPDPLLAPQATHRGPAFLPRLVEDRSIEVRALIQNARPSGVRERLQHRRGDEIVGTRRPRQHGREAHELGREPGVDVGVAGAFRPHGQHHQPCDATARGSATPMVTNPRSAARNFLGNA